MRHILILLFIYIHFCVQSENITIASFNTLRLGENKKNYFVMAKIISKFDLIGLEEVITEKGLKKLKYNIEKYTNEKWEYIISEKSVGTAKYREYYAFLYKKEKISLIKPIGLFNEDDKNQFIREPYGAYFKSKNFDFVFIICHSIFGENEKGRIIEASQYKNVYEYYKKIANENDILLAGDFNLPANNLAFNNLRNVNMTYLLDPNKFLTTISNKGLSSAYDNIFINKNETLEYTGRYGVYDFTKNNNRLIKKWISDHLLVFAEFSNTLDID